MILDDFAALARQRIPTAEEFVEFVAAQGWLIVARPDGSAALRAPAGEPLVKSLARLLAREPYRTNVLAVAMRRWRQPEAPPPPRLREWKWVGGMVQAEDPEFAPAPDRHPGLAVWWRYAGETQWRLIPGRTPPLADAPVAEPKPQAEAAPGLFEQHQ